MGFSRKRQRACNFAAQEQALIINSIKDKCRVYGTKEETVLHLVSGCLMLAKKQYKIRHENVAKRVYLELCKKDELESPDMWYEHTPADVVENDEVELYCDLTIQIDMTVTHNRLDSFLVEKAIWKWTIIDVAVLGDFNVVRTEGWKVEKYQDLAFQVKRIHHVEAQLVACSPGFNPHLCNFYNIIRFVRSLSIPTVCRKTITPPVLTCDDVDRTIMNNENDSCLLPITFVKSFKIAFDINFSQLSRKKPVL